MADKQYYWSALCRRVPSDPNHTVQVTVFVSRKVGAGTMYPGPGPGGSVIAWPWPVPMSVGVWGTVNGTVLTVDPNTSSPIDETRWISDGCTIVENSTGQVFRVVEQGATASSAFVVLDPGKPWLWDDDPTDPSRPVWVVPPPLIQLDPPVVGGRGPCIAVYQKLIRF